MKTWIYRFSAKQLQSIHPDHLGFVLASSHCCNELTSIYPFIIFEQQIDEPTEAENALILIRFFTLVRLQIAKIFEYRDLCNRYFATIRKTFPNRAQELGSRFAPISRRINSARWAETLRNKVAFHFDASYARDSLNHLTPDHELTFVVGRMRGVTAYDFADRILVAALFSEAGGGDSETGRDVVRKWTIELSAQISHFHAQIMQELFDQYGLMKNRAEIELRDQYCAMPGAIAIPLSTPDAYDQS